MENPTPRIVFSKDDIKAVRAKINSRLSPWKDRAPEILDYCARIANEQLAAEVKPVFEVGKRYRTTDGTIAGPLMATMATSDSCRIFDGALSDSREGAVWSWTNEGFFYSSQTPTCYDLQPGAIEDEPAPAAIPAAESEQVLAALRMLAEAFRQAEALTGVKAALAKYEAADSIGILPEYWHQLKKEAHAALAAWDEIVGDGK